MHFLERSIPGTISSTEETPPVAVSTTSKDSTMASSGFVTFAKSILLPLSISAFLYLLIFHALLPLYRRHRARYSQYLPLQSASISSRLPEFLQGLSLRDRMSHIFFRLFLPSTWAFRDRFRRRDSVISADGELFDVESGEAMVGFDVQDRNQRRDGMERQMSNMNAAARTVARANEPMEVDSNRRLSRELEEGFRDDSDDEGQSNQVTAARQVTTARR